MIIVMEVNAPQEAIDDILQRLKEMNLVGHLSVGIERTVIGVVGHTPLDLKPTFETWPNVEEVLFVGKPFKLASREFRNDDTIIQVGDVTIGNGMLVVVAGPCSVESEAQVIETAIAVKKAGATMLRGGAFKPRTSPYTFRGLGEEALKYLAKAREETGLPVVTEVMSVRDVDLVAKYADILQIGARNSQNFNLLDEMGEIGKPVLLKRGVAGTIQELLLSAEYILSRGNRQVILCERGIRTFETMTRNTLDLNAVPVLRSQSHLPVFVDPSHGTGKWSLVKPLALASVAAGAQGLLIEVHPSPDHALSDGPQSLTPENFAALMDQVRKVADAVGMKMAAQPQVPAGR